MIKYEFKCRRCSKIFTKPVPKADVPKTTLSPELQLEYSEISRISSDKSTVKEFWVPHVCSDGNAGITDFRGVVDTDSVVVTDEEGVMRCSKCKTKISPHNYVYDGLCEPCRQIKSRKKND